MVWYSSNSLQWFGIAQFSSMVWYSSNSIQGYHIAAAARSQLLQQEIFHRSDESRNYPAGFPTTEIFPSDFF
jgi:hypothetical protein